MKLKSVFSGQTVRQYSIGNFIYLFLVEPGLYLRQVKETSEVTEGEENNILLCQYLRYFSNQTIYLDEVTYLNGDNCTTIGNADVIWTQYLRGELVGGSLVSNLFSCMRGHLYYLNRFS